MAMARRPSMSGRNRVPAERPRPSPPRGSRRMPAPDPSGGRVVRSSRAAASAVGTLPGDERVAHLVGNQAGDVAAETGDLLHQ